MWQRPAQPALHDRSSGPSLLLSSEAKVHTLPHTHKHESLPWGIIVYEAYYCHLTFIPSVLTIRKRRASRCFILLSARVNQHRRLDDYPTKKARLGTNYLSIRCALYRKQEKIRAEAMVEYVCAASASLSWLLLARYTHQSTSYCSTTDDEVL